MPATHSEPQQTAVRLSFWRTVTSATVNLCEPSQGQLTPFRDRSSMRANEFQLSRIMQASGAFWRAQRKLFLPQFVERQDGGFHEEVDSLAAAALPLPSSGGAIAVAILKCRCTL